MKTRHNIAFHRHCGKQNRYVILTLPEIICICYKPLQLEPCLFTITMHCLCYNWSTLWNCNEKNLFIVPLVSISTVENSTWTDVDSAPIQHFGWGFSPDHWWHWWRSAALQANSTVRSISNTQLNNRFQLSQLYNSLLLCISLTSQNLYNILIIQSAVVCRNNYFLTLQMHGMQQN